jgi:hypothetical protein
VGKILLKENRGKAMEKLPTLSTDNWLQEPLTVMNKLYEYFMLSGYNQSNTYKGEVSSLRYLLHKYDTIDELENKIILALDILYSRYFDNVDVEVNLTYQDEDEVHRLLEINVITLVDNKKYTLQKSTNINNSKIENIREGDSVWL